MWRPAEAREFPKYPVTAGVFALCVVGTLGWWAGKLDVGPMVETVGIRRGEVWRLVTSCILHGSVLHLAFNLYWWWVFGTVVEGWLGHWRFAALAVLLAAGSGAAEFAVLDGGVGLSGVGYGLFGMLWVLSRRDARFAGVVDGQTVGLFVVWFFVCIALTVTGVYPVANVAHGVGGVLGALVGLAAARGGTGRERGAGWAGFVGVWAVCVAGAVWGRPWVNFSKTAWQEEAGVGYEMLEAGRNAEAVRWYREAARMGPGDADNWYNLGIACERVGDRAGAVGAYGKACELAPGDEGKLAAWGEAKRKAK